MGAVLARRARQHREGVGLTALGARAVGPVDPLDVAIAIAREAGALLVDRATRAPVGVSSKSTRTDLVSDADRAADALVVERIRSV